MIFTFGFAKIRTMSIFATDVLKQMFSNAKISILLKGNNCCCRA